MSEVEIVHHRSTIEIPHVRAQLIQLLAEGQESVKQLAERFNCSASGVYDFRNRHADEIRLAQQRRDKQLSHLWIADQVSRIAEYQECFERIRKILDDTDLRANVNTAEMIRAQASMLKAVAEEVGDLTHKVETRSVSVNYVVEGVDMSKLQ